MSNPIMMESGIPFAGFYESIHSQNLDNALEYLTQDGNGDQFVLTDADGLEETPGNDMWEHIKWNDAQQAYAKLFTKAFADHFKVETGIDLKAQFSEMISPKFYNFTTDRLFIKIPRSVVLQLWKVVNKESLDRMIAKRFTSYDGFMSFYDNSLGQWLGKEPGSNYRMSGGRGTIAKWDANQVGVLLECILYQFAPEYHEYELAEAFDDNGELTEILYDALTPEGHGVIKRLDDIRQKAYIEERDQMNLFQESAGQ
jgi:hypothetical protein